MASVSHVSAISQQSSVMGYSTATNNNNSSNIQRMYNQNRQVWAGRIMFLMCLCAVAVVLGILTYSFLIGSENELAERQFDSIADRALDAAAGITERKRWSTIAMASVVSAMLPDADDWPFVHVNEFEQIARSILRTSAGDDMGFVPLVTLDKQAAFEEFAYDYFKNVRNFTSATAISSFGKGIWFLNPKSEAPDKRFHVTTGDTIFDSPNDILTPVFHVDEGEDPILMFNLHSEPGRGKAIDDMLECSNNNSNLVDEASDYRCGVITTKVRYVKYQNFGPTSLIFQPIYPANNPTTMVGFIPTPLLWDWILENAFHNGTNGIDCILSIENEHTTYSVVDGTAQYIGEGDFHQTKYDRLKMSILLTGGELYTDNSPIYKLTLYPTDDFYEDYHTTNPMAATIGAVTTILLTSIFFLFYDFYVRRAFSANQNLLEAKRQFMRFVSHEVRTPLNSVCMGLTVIQTELAASLGYNSPNDVPQSLPALIDPAPTPAPAPIQRRPNNDSSTSTTSTDDSMEISKNNNKKDVPQLQASNSSNSAANPENILEWFQLAQEIQSNAQSAVDVLSDLLNYDKIEQGNLALELTPVPIWKLVEKTTNEFKLPAAKKNITLKVAFLMESDASDIRSKQNDDEEQRQKQQRLVASTKGGGAELLPKDMRVLKLIGDSVRVTQVLRNLISNAIKFTPEQGNVVVEAIWMKDSSLSSSGQSTNLDNRVFTLKNGQEVNAESRGSIQVCVKDSGVGLSEDQVLNLFRDGIQFNVNELQAGQGSGLGLYISHGIVKQHGGALEADSKGKGHGTTFRMTLPIYYDLQEEQKVEEAKELMKEQAGVTVDNTAVSALKILIVDDVMSNRKLLERLLKRKDHICDQAENGLIAVDRVVQAIQEGVPFDTVLMDYEMPEMNGPEAAAAIRANGSDVFIVGITGNMLPEDVAFYKSQGANVVMSKPFKLSDLEEWWMEYDISPSNNESMEEAIA